MCSPQGRACCPFDPGRSFCTHRPGLKHFQASVILIQTLNTHVSSDKQEWKGDRLGLWRPNAREDYALLEMQLECFHLGNSEPVFHILLQSPHRSRHLQKHLQPFRFHRPFAKTACPALPYSNHTQLLSKLCSEPQAGSSMAQYSLLQCWVPRTYHTLCWELQGINTSELTLHLYI